MKPPPNESDLSDLPKYPPPLPPLGSARERRSCHPLQSFLLYCLCGALVGGGIGILVTPISQVIRHDLRFGMVDKTELNGVLREMPEFMLAGSVNGIIWGGLLRLAVVLSSMVKRPIFAAALCASLGGVVALLNIVAPNLEARPPQGHEIIEMIVVTSAVMCFAALFGGVHAFTVRRAIAWFEAWLNRRS